MKAREKVINFLDENFDYFIDELSRFKKLQLEDDIDYRVDLVCITTDEYKQLFNLPLVNCHYYMSYGCSCGHDCCGCLSSISVDVVKNKGYMCIYTRLSLNY